MNTKTFAAFVGPSIFLMLLFIAAPLVSDEFESNVDLEVGASV